MMSVLLEGSCHKHAAGGAMGRKRVDVRSLL